MTQPFDTVNRLYGLRLGADELAAWFAKVAEPKEHAATSKDAVVSHGHAAAGVTPHAEAITWDTSGQQPAMLAPPEVLSANGQRTAVPSAP